MFHCAVVSRQIAGRLAAVDGRYGGLGHGQLVFRSASVADEDESGPSSWPNLMPLSLFCMGLMGTTFA